jgi:hypothetical protein
MSSAVETSLTISEDFWRQVVPPRAHRCDQRHFLLPRPILELLFPRDCAQHIGAMLVVKELATAEIRSESWNFSRAVLADSAGQIIGHANVEHGVVIISHNIDPEIVVSHHLEKLEIPRLRSE